jgi:hypothetical protein
MAISQQLRVLHFELQNQVIQIEALRADPSLVSVNGNVAFMEVAIIGIADVYPTATTMVVRPFGVTRCPLRELETPSLKPFESLQYRVFSTSGHFSLKIVATRLISTTAHSLALQRELPQQRILRQARWHWRFETPCPMLSEE